MTAPLVTVGLTCFNAQQTIPRAIASARRQDWPNLEIIIVDDVSSDGSVATIEAAIEGDPRVRLIRHVRNSGPAGARNTVLQEARGEFVAFFDDDDESLPERVSTQVKAIVDYERQTGSDLVACYASGQRRYPNGHVVELSAIGSRGGEAPNGPAVADYLLTYRRKPEWFYGTGTPSCSLMARRSAFAAAGGFDPELRRVEDVDLAIRFALKNGHFIGTEQSLFVQYSTGAADKSPEKNLEAEQKLAVKYRDYLQSTGHYYYAYHWPELRYWHFKRNYLRLALVLLQLMLRYPFASVEHLLATGPRRLWHERNITRKTGQT